MEKRRWEESEKRREEKKREEKRREGKRREEKRRKKKEEERRKKEEDQKRESLRRKKIQVREKVGKSRNTVFFQWFEPPECIKGGLLKRRVRSQLARWEMKQLHAVVARSTFPSQNVQNTPGSDHFWKLRCRKKCTPLWREAHFEDKM